MDQYCCDFLHTLPSNAPFFYQEKKQELYNESCLDHLSDIEPVFYAKRGDGVFFAKFFGLPVAVKLSNYRENEFQIINQLTKVEYQHLVTIYCFEILSNENVTAFLHKNKSRLIGEELGVVNAKKYEDNYYRLGWNSNVLVLVMERLNPGNISVFFVNPQFSIHTFLSVLWQVLTTIYFLQQQGIAHHDFFDRNLWIKSIDPKAKYLRYELMNSTYYLPLEYTNYQMIKIGDYGLARLASEYELKCTDLIDIGFYLASRLQSNAKLFTTSERLKNILVCMICCFKPTCSEAYKVPASKCPANIQTIESLLQDSLFEMIVKKVP